METRPEEEKKARRDFLPWIFMVVFIIEFVVFGWFYLGYLNGTYDFSLWILIVITIVGTLLTAVIISYLYYRKRMRLAEKYGWFEEDEMELEEKEE